MKRLFFVIAALLIAVIIYDVQQYFFATTDIETNNKARKTIDYYFTRFDMMSFQAQGQPQYEIRGEHLAHSQDQKVSEIMQPSMKSFDLDETIKSELNANYAELAHTPNTLNLSGNVKLLDNSQTQLTTEYLHANLNTKEIKTNRHVFIQSPTGHMQSTGMNGRLDDGYLRLHSNVQTIYQTPTSTAGATTP